MSVISTPHKLPMSDKEANRINPIITYAQELGILFLKIHPRLPASGEEALEASTNLYLNQFKHFGLEWEAKYFNAYYQAIEKGNNLAPQGLIGHNHENTMYYVQTAQRRNHSPSNISTLILKAQSLQIPCFEG